MKKPHQDIVDYIKNPSSVEIEMYMADCIEKSPSSLKWTYHVMVGWWRWYCFLSSAFVWSSPSRCSLVLWFPLSLGFFSSTQYLIIIVIIVIFVILFARRNDLLFSFFYSTLSLFFFFICSSSFSGFFFCFIFPFFSSSSFFLIFFFFYNAISLFWKKQYSNECDMVAHMLQYYDIHYIYYNYDIYCMKHRIM